MKNKNNQGGAIMLKTILKVTFTLLGAVIGWFLGTLVMTYSPIKSMAFLKDPVWTIVINVIMSLLTAFIFYLISPVFVRFVAHLIDSVDRRFQNVSLMDVVLGAVGGLVALAIAYFLTQFLYEWKPVGPALAAVINVIAFIIGASIATRKHEEIGQVVAGLRPSKTGGTKLKNKKEYNGDPKVLDTSVIIDGRIFDLCQTGFVEGSLIVPAFVLDELRHIADSSDGLKRNRGRRGLDVLNKIQNELDMDVVIWEKDVTTAREVDIKLLHLAKELGGKVVTNDYNLNKVAEFQGVPVLNINELANALKPVLLPGEEMSILVAKNGKEMNQGIGYLDDGTMIVIENGRRHVGETIEIIVTSVLQTAAGRMIFARPKDER